MIWISRIEFLFLKYVRYYARNASKITPFARTFPIPKVPAKGVFLLAFLAELRAVYRFWSASHEIHIISLSNCIAKKKKKN